MKIALCFRFTQTFCLRSAQEGAIFSRCREKKEILKAYKPAYTKGTSSLLCYWDQGFHPRHPKKQNQEQKWHFAPLVSFQKQKLTIVKTFMIFNAEKSGNQGEE